MLEELEKSARLEQNFDKALSRLIAEKFNLLSRGTEFLYDVEERLKHIEKALEFDVTMSIYADFKAQTREFKKSISVTLRRNIKEDELLTVLVHELGEVDYLSRNLPIVFNEKEDEVNGRLIELFSHPHARRIASTFGLAEIEGKFRETEVLHLIHFHNKTEYINTLDKVIKICWLLSTYPNLWKHRTELDGYCENSPIINEIYSIVSETNTMLSVEVVEDSMNKVIDILRTLDLPEHIIVKSRNV